MSSTTAKIWIKLFIHNPYQDPIEIDIAPTAKILDLKKMIATRFSSILFIGQVLKFRSKILNDSDTILSFGIQANSVVELTMQNCYKIFIKTEDNRIHELDVHFTNTVELVKKMLNRLLKIAVDHQRLMFNGKELKNDGVLTDLLIKPGTTINLMLTNLNLQLNIVQRSGQVECIGIPKNFTIAQLKQVILGKYKVPADYQILTYKDQILDKNDKTFADYNIEDLSEINFRPNDIEIFIKFASMGRNRITLRVLPIDTIGQVKDKIVTESKINKNQLQIIWGGRILDDNAIIASEKICDGSSLILVVTVQNLLLNIQIAPGDKIPIDAQSNETVAQLKSKLTNATKIPIEQQILVVDDTKLQDGKILIDYGINEDSDIVLERKDTFEILIDSSTGHQITICVHKNDSVSFIKTQIERRLGVKPAHQRLICFGKELKDDILAAYGIENRCTVYLVRCVIT